MKALTIREFFKTFPDDDSCLEHVFQCRFGQSYDCPKCEKATKWHKLQSERAYSCQYCGHHLHPTVGTLFEKSRTPLQLWFYAIYLFTTTSHGVSAKELERQLGVTYKTAWRMGHEIREHMADVDGDPVLGGHIEIDEAYFGGKDRVMGRPNPATTKKKMIVGMVSRDGDIRTEHVQDVRSATLLPLIEEAVEQGATISTDENNTYRNLPAMGFKHGIVRHKMEEWKTGIHHTNTIESYWSCLKRSIHSTHIHVSKKHMQKYLKEFEYRYNTRTNPSEMFPELISTYSEPDSK